MGLGKPRNTEKSERDRRWMWTLLCSSFSNKTLNTLKMRLLCLHSKEINNTLSPLLCAIKYKSSALTYNGHRHFTVWNGGYLSQNCVSLFASLRMKSGDINLICCHNLISSWVPLIVRYWLKRQYGREETYSMLSPRWEPWLPHWQPWRW